MLDKDPPYTRPPPPSEAPPTLFSTSHIIIHLVFIISPVLMWMSNKGTLCMIWHRLVVNRTIKCR